ncbi:transcriptional regulator with XRE-family HTH domain [Bradyrhizobium elkanii]
MRKGTAARPATARRAARTPAKKPAKKPASKPAEPAMDLAVGRRIRDLRRSKEMSLEVVAARTDLSIGFISQIERGLSSPSLRVLATLADVLGVGIAALFGATPKDDGAGGVVTREVQRAELKLWRTGISKQLLSPVAPAARAGSICSWCISSPAATPATSSIPMTAKKPASCSRAR